MLTIISAGTDTCLWCASEKEGVQVEFADGTLKGFLCKADFWKLVKARGNRKSVAKDETPQPSARKRGSGAVEENVGGDPPASRGG